MSFPVLHTSLYKCRIIFRHVSDIIVNISHLYQEMFDLIALFILGVLSEDIFPLHYAYIMLPNLFSVKVHSNPKKKKKKILPSQLGCITFFIKVIKNNCITYSSHLPNNATYLTNVCIFPN